MRAEMTQKIDTLWSNSLEVKLTCELDNPHVITARELATLMVSRMQDFMEEVRSENERVARIPADVREADKVDTAGQSEAERERFAFEQTIESRRDPRESEV